MILQELIPCKISCGRYKRQLKTYSYFCHSETMALPGMIKRLVNTPTYSVSIGVARVFAVRSTVASNSYDFFSHCPLQHYTKYPLTPKLTIRTFPHKNEFTPSGGAPYKLHAPKLSPSPKMSSRPGVHLHLSWSWLRL